MISIRLIFVHSYLKLRNVTSSIQMSYTIFNVNKFSGNYDLAQYSGFYFPYTEWFIKWALTDVPQLPYSITITTCISIINGIHSKYKDVRKSKNVRSCYSNQVVWPRSANKNAYFFRTSAILMLSYILQLTVNTINYFLFLWILRP